MIDPVLTARWPETRDYLKSTADRFATMLSAVGGRGNATADWSVADTAAHVAILSGACARLVGAGGDSGQPDNLIDMIEGATVDTVADFNQALLGQFGERDPEALARKITTDIDRILSATDAADPAGPVSWLGGSSVPYAGVLAHMLNELQIHGRDIARAARVPWTVRSVEASVFFDLFLMGVTQYGYGRLLEGHGPWPKRRVAVEFRSKYTTPRTMAIEDGDVRVEAPGPNADVRLSFEPVTLNLMLFGRISKPRAAITGKVIVRGPRPWLLPSFLRIVRLPS